MEEMDKCGRYVDWEAELLVMAASMDKPVAAFGLQRRKAEELYMCRSYLIHIEDSMPVNSINFSSRV